MAFRTHTDPSNPQDFIADIGIGKDGDEHKLTVHQLYRTTKYAPTSGPESCDKGDFDPEHCICASTGPIPKHRYIKMANVVIDELEKAIKHDYDN